MVAPLLEVQEARTLLARFDAQALLRSPVRGDAISSGRAARPKGPDEVGQASGDPEERRRRASKRIEI